MKFIIFLYFGLIITNATADSTLNRQFSNRNWNYDVALRSRQDHLISYSDMDILDSTISYMSAVIQDFSTIDYYKLSLAFPETYIEEDSARIELKEKFEKTVSSYKILQEWDSLLVAIGTERWEDPNPSSCAQAANPLTSADCGRRSKGNFAISNLTTSQIQTLSDFKQVIFDELKLIEEANGELAIGPGPARIFQFLYDSRSIDYLIQKSYVIAHDPNNSQLRKINIVDIGRALIIQMFQGQNGKLVNSDLIEIDLEKDACFLEAEINRPQCQLDYMRFLVWDRNFAAPQGQLVKNLIMDMKVIKPFFNILITKFTKENPESVIRSQLIAFLERAYFSLCAAYDLNPATLSADPRFYDLTISRLKSASDYLINKRNIIGLQIARGLQELILFVEAHR